jgi:hypothetical protein
VSKSDSPTFRTGTIVTPTNPVVTDRKSTACRIGKGDAPDNGLARPASMATGTSIVGKQNKVTRDSLATELAKSSTDEGTAPVRILLGNAERTPLDRAMGIFRETNGTVKVNGKKVTLTRLCRTEDMGDARLPVAPAAQTVEVEAGPAQRVKVSDPAKDARKEARREEDAMILAWLRSMNYTGSLNADIRGLALDALAFAQQITA